ncbi:Dps family protein [Catelliglobosispora koreensis]|uniref:Dps family protein n=1 Tax=Catelliglobosispora koreensis TaxID=129052 RepID=UPI0003685B9D|nr:DNA starvation/stationary phase protection protein [Catelliglobosispora koreensis]
MSDDKKAVGEALQTALADLINLGLQSKQAHWNLTGPHFRPIHLQLDELVDLAREHADTIAERAVAIGFAPDGRPETVAREGQPDKFGAGPVKDTAVVAGITALLEAVSHRLREGINDTADPDPVSQDLLIAAAHDLEKQRWMFAAQIG